MIPKKRNYMKNTMTTLAVCAVTNISIMAALIFGFATAEGVVTGHFSFDPKMSVGFGLLFTAVSASLLFYRYEKMKSHLRNMPLTRPTKQRS